MEELNSIFESLVAICARAGELILEVYGREFPVEMKEDNSPLTEADRASHEYICSELIKISVEGRIIPLISEEGDITPYEERRLWDYYWLIDPLDGTKEFVKKNGEFTVNIALMKNSRPYAGVVYVPVTGVVYYGSVPTGSFRADVEDGKPVRTVQVPDLSADRRDDVLVAAGSRSHRSEEFDSFVNEWVSEKGYSSAEIVTAGSSLKFCMIAEGAADIYPRFGPTMEWDTAAAHAVVEGAGRSFTSLDGSEFPYNKKSLKNGGFLVF